MHFILIYFLSMHNLCHEELQHMLDCTTMEFLHVISLGKNEKEEWDHLHIEPPETDFLLDAIKTSVKSLLSKIELSASANNFLAHTFLASS